MLQDCRTSCIYRIAQEGLPLLLPWMGKQVVHVRAETLLRQLTEGSLALPESHRLPMEVACLPPLHLYVTLCMHHVTRGTAVQGFIVWHLLAVVMSCKRAMCGMAMISVAWPSY